MQAQLKDKLVPHAGFMYEFVTISTIPIPGSDAVQTVRSFYTLNLGGYYTLLHKNDVLSLGIEPNVNLGFDLFQLQNKIAFDYMVQAPVFIMGRLGANATPYNQQRWGVGVGIGGTYTLFSQQVTLTNRNKAQFFTPQAMAQLTIGGGHNSSFTIRAHFSLKPIQGMLKNTAGSDSRVNFSNLGLGLIYSL
ncbi:MAG: hypothetical protein D6730_15005 [Bacteroidetes bacterium]|nr:MAG: hypothetical protein D6730_15005 [Bacteroidota bacterium]